MGMGTTAGTTISVTAHRPAALVLVPCDWSQVKEELFPGAWVADFTESSLQARIAGFEVRDSVLIATPKGLRTVWLYRKPLEKSTVRDQVLATGTGAINIDACRVAADMSEFLSPGTGGPRSGVGTHFSWKGEFGGDKANPPNPKGRWPANLMLMHAPGCENKEIKQVEAWECTQDCPALLLDTQSGDRRSTLTGKADPATSHENPGDNHGKSLFGGGNSRVYADKGGAARFYQQFSGCQPDCPVQILDGQSGDRPSTGDHPSEVKCESKYRPNQGAYQGQGPLYSDKGGASRYYSHFWAYDEIVGYFVRLLCFDGCDPVTLIVGLT